MVGNVACMGEMRNAYWSESMKERDN